MAILRRLIFPNKSLEYLSISLNHLWFALLMFYSSQHLSLSPPWSSLFLSFFFFCDFKRDCFFTFPFWHFIVNVKKCNWFPYVHLESCCLVDLISLVVFVNFTWFLSNYKASSPNHQLQLCGYRQMPLGLVVCNGGRILVQSIWHIVGTIWGYCC